VFERIRKRSLIEGVASEAAVQAKLWRRDQERSSKGGDPLYRKEELKKETKVPDEETKGRECPDGKKQGTVAPARVC
jgi:hypothetical protein